MAYLGFHQGGGSISGGFGGKEGIEYLPRIRKSRRPNPENKKLGSIYKYFKHPQDYKSDFLYSQR